jgi:hypothetical protein
MSKFATSQSAITPVTHAGLVRGMHRNSAAMFERADFFGTYSCTLP